MSRLTRLLSTAAVSLVLAGAAHAGAVGDFEASMRSAYADYRGALFQTNAGNKDAAVKAIGAFKATGPARAAAGAGAPPQYADEAAAAAAGAAGAARAAGAAAEAADGKLADAHETLEGIRDQIGGLHERNGLIAFSDRMNAYHAWMEMILGKGYAGFGPEGLADLRDDAAVLAYLAADIAAHPPAESTDPAYQGLLDSVSASVAALGAAAEAGDAAAAKQAVGGLKTPYSKLFLKFG